MKAIGGYFGLELNSNFEYHRDAISLNTGRNAFEYILLAFKYTKVYIPYFTCDVLLEPIKKLGLKYEFYSIDEQFEPLFDYSKIQNEDCFLYTNYFGLKDSFVKKLSNKCKNLIIDNAQSFYSKPLDNVDTFYSPRKFFGVSDGAYLYTNKRIKENLKRDISYQRFEHLLRRIDETAEDGYKAFSLNDQNLNNSEILQMSNLTKRLLESIDYDLVAKQRINNYLFLDKKLRGLNKLQLVFDSKQIPMVYPFWSNRNLKNRLLDKRIYCATYWPNVLEWVRKDSLEFKLASEVIYLPIDQRYGEKDMTSIIKLILK